MCWNNGNEKSDAAVLLEKASPICSPGEVFMRELPSARVEELRDRLLRFMEESIYPAEKIYEGQLDAGASRWIVPPVMEELKAQAKAGGLWNLFLPKHEFPQGLTVSEYAPL